METIGFDAEAAQQQALVAVLGVFLIFSFMSPVGGMVMYRLLRRFVPADEVIVLAGTALVIFVMCFALLFGIMLRVPALAVLSLPVMLVVSLFGAGWVTAIMAIAVLAIIRRGTRRIDPKSSTFGVWEEDARRRPKNLRRR